MVGFTTMQSRLVINKHQHFYLNPKSLSKWLEMRRFFAKLKIPNDEPWPLIGNSIQMFKQPLFYFHMNLIRKHGRTVGYFEGTRPVILTTDVAFIKHFMIKDFNSFPNRRTFNQLSVPPADKFLSDIKGEEWKNVRSIVSTTFTSGKLKSVIIIIIIIGYYYPDRSSWQRENDHYLTGTPKDSVEL
jgi:cytochrome P450